MNTTVNTNRTENMNAAAMVAGINNKINDFGQKIGGARKDLYQAANEWAEKLADITAEALTKAGGVSKLVRLPNLESMTAAGAITSDQARAALIIWRGIERKPQGSYRADRWAERTRARLEAAAAIITGTEPTADEVRDIITAARNSAEFLVLTAAQWPAVAFSFGKYGAARPYYGNKENFVITTGDRRYYPHEYTTPAAVVAQLREMVAADEEKAADRRAAGPALGVYTNRAGVYYIAPTNAAEIVLQTYEDRTAAFQALREDRAALVERYAALKNFPACRRDWNRPRVGEDWRKGENMTPETYAAVLPFRGVEFGNWVNQTERAALLNSAFDGFHDLAAVLNIAPAAVTLNGSLAFAFASRGHSKAAAHYEPARRVINLTKKSGAGCMAHEWFHAVDNFAAGGGLHNYATERADHPRAFAILQAIKGTAYYKRSQNLAYFKGDYWTEGRELTARAFEGVCAVMLNAAGICSDFLVNCKSMDEFTAEDVARRSDYYPYPTADEAAALLPLYIDFLREVFGEVLTAPAACYAEAERAAARAEAERKEAERIAAERAEAERQERERKAQEMREKAAREAEARKEAAAHTLELLREVLTARHFDTIATSYDAATAYAVAHLEGEIYTLRADIETANQQGRAYIESLPAACVNYKRVHNAKRIICRRWQLPEIRANKYTARELVEGLNMIEIRDICRTYCDFEKAETWAKAAQIWSDTQSAKAAAPATTKPEAKKATEKPAKAQNGAPAEGLHLEEMADGVRVVGDDWKDTYFNKRQIKENGAHWNKDAKQWEATDPADVARLRAWFALRDGENTTAPTVEDPAEITATESAPALPDWLKVGAKVRTRGAYMMSTRSNRPEWVEGEEMTIKAISAEFVELEKRDENGALTGLQSISTAKAADELTPVLYEPAEITAPAENLAEAVREWSANDYAATHHGATLTDWDKAHPAPVEWCKPGQVFKLRQQFNGRDIYAIITKLGTDCFFYVGNFGNCSEHLSAYAAQQWDNLQPVEIMHEDTPKFAKMFERFHSIRKAWEADGVNIWEERERKEKAPLYEASEITAPAAAEPVAASYDTESDKAGTISTPTRAKAYTYQDQPAADTLPEDLPAELLKFYEVNRDASDENPAPVCLFYEPGVKKYQAFGSDAHLLATEFGAAVITFTQTTEYKHGKFFPYPIDQADFPAAELSARLQWLNREGYAVAVFAFADGLPTLNPAAPDWQERDKARRAQRYSETMELGDGVTRIMESERNIYDCHYELSYRYYKGGDLLAMFHATGYPEKWDYIGTIRPPHAGRFSNGAMVEHFATIWQAERYILAEIAKGLQPYHKPTTPAPEPKGKGDELADIISQAKQAEKWSANGKYNYGPIESLRAAAYKHTTTAEEYTKFFDEHLNEVTNAETYCVWLLRAYDITVDETQVFCDLRRAFPAIGFKEACKLIRDHMGENQQGNGIAAALVPDFVLIESTDQDTRRKFMERRKCYTNMTVKWAGNGERHPEELRKRYDLDSMTLHALLDWELFYTWESARAARALEDLREVYPEATADDLHRVFMAASDGVSSIYG